MHDFPDFEEEELMAFQNEESSILLDLPLTNAKEYLMEKLNIEEELKSDEYYA